MTNEQQQVPAQRLLERFLRYVKIDTTAVEAANQYPSSAGQWELGRMLVEELQAMGIENARQDEHHSRYVNELSAGKCCDVQRPAPHPGTADEFTNALCIHVFGDACVPANEEQRYQNADQKRQSDVLAGFLLRHFGHVR